MSSGGGTGGNASVTVDAPDNSPEAVNNWWAGNSDAWAAGTPATYDPITGAQISAGSGGGYMTQIYQQYLDSITNQNKFSWVQHLLVPGLQAAANILLLNKQKEQYDEIEEERIGHIDAAVTRWCECMDEILADIKNATDDVPKPAIYQAVSPSGEQWQTVSDNLQIAQASREYICYLNKTHREQEIIRAVALNPKYHEMNELTWCSIHDLMRGIIPKGLTVETLTRSKEKAVKNGRYGRSARQTARDLGFIDYRLQKAARAEQREERASMNRDVSPIAKLADVREMMVTPQQRITFGIQQAQLIQNSDQNAYNACARKAPYLMQKVQIMMQKCQQEMTLLAGKAGLVNSNVIDYASVLNNQVRTITQGIGNAVSGINIGNPTNTAPTPAQPIPPSIAPTNGGGFYGGGYVDHNSGK